MTIRKIKRGSEILFKSLKSFFFHDFIKYYPHYRSIEEFLEISNLEKKNLSKSLDIGCGRNIKNPFNAKEYKGIDLIEESNVIKHDVIASPLPFKDNSYEFCTAFDFLEHVPRVLIKDNSTYFPFIELLNDIYRVLKPNGYFLHITPAFPSKLAYQDPTHVNIITEDTFPKYFCANKNKGKKPKASMYGFNGNFTLIKQGWYKDHWIIGILKAEK